MENFSRIALIFTVIVSYAMAYNFTVNVGEQLDGKIIHIEALRYRGYWLKSSFYKVVGKWVTAAVLPEQQTYYTQWSKFKVRHIGKGVVLLQSMTYPNRYVDSHFTKWLRITYSSYPDNQDWAHWKITCTSADMSNCIFEAMKYQGKYFATTYRGNLEVFSYGESFSRFRIFAPKPKDYYRTVWSTENNSGADQKKFLTLQEGTSDTTSRTNTLTSAVTSEIQNAFAGGVEASLSYEWTQTNSKTFEKSTSFSYEINIPAHTKIEVKQLTGVYGPFRIQANKFIIDQTNLKTRKRTTRSLQK